METEGKMEKMELRILLYRQLLLPGLRPPLLGAFLLVFPFATTPQASNLLMTTKKTCKAPPRPLLLQVISIFSK